MVSFVLSQAWPHAMLLIRCHGRRMAFLSFEVRIEHLPSSTSIALSE